MSLRKNFSVVVAFASLLTLASCGGNSSSKKHSEPQKQQEALSVADWKIFLQGRNFPTRSLVMVNDSIVVDECSGKSPFAIDRNVDPQMIAMNDYTLPVEGSLKVMVRNCRDMSEAPIVDQDNVPFDMSEKNGKLEVIINL